MAPKKRNKSNSNFCTWKDTLFKSEFEMLLAQQLEEAGVKWEYEPDKLLWYPKPKEYTPDFKVYNEDGSYYYIEAKGWFRPESRSKMERVHELHPDVDIRYVFMKATNKLNSKVKKPTTYADWCDARGFLWAEQQIPKGWLRERHTA